MMDDRQKRVIAYGLQTAKPQSVNQNAPTFPPTALKFQTYEYIAPGKQDPEEGIRKGDSNMLLYYLQMTDHKISPQGNPNYSGNFVSSAMNGTTCIALEIFWDSSLLRVLFSLLGVGAVWPGLFGRTPVSLDFWVFPRPTRNFGLKQIFIS